MSESKIIVSPSILSADFANLERDIKLVEESGADWIHVDVMDGHFVPNITIGAPVVKSIKQVTKLPLDVHLMIENPEKFIEDFVKVGSDIITFHYEAVVSNYCDKRSPDSVSAVIDMINLIKSFGVKVGLSIKPRTSAEEILQFLPYLDLVLVMTVEPGFGGQKFMEDCAEKLKVIKKVSSKNMFLQVDGGINAETARICTCYGANSLVAGNYIYKSNNVKTAITSLKHL